MTAPIRKRFETLAPMEARLASDLPDEGRWQFEPKWDGFRALILRDGKASAIRSRSGKPLDRYFPEVVASIEAIAEPAILDGELILPIGGRLSFDALQARLHPAQSRVERLARETPAELMLFDCLWLGERRLNDRPLGERRDRLEALIAAGPYPGVSLSPFSLDRADARRWLDRGGGALDGVVAKPLDAPYRPGERAMVKVKRVRTADCVVGGFRRAADGSVASLLLGLYNDEGLLDHVGFVSAIPAAERLGLAARLEPLIEPPGFSGKAPGGPSRWNRGEAHEWLPLRPELVAEVGYDQITANRFRHAARLIRWRPDKAPRQCTFEQLAPPLRPAELAQLIGKR